MTKRFEILDENGAVINTCLSSPEWMEDNFAPNLYRQLPDPEPMPEPTKRILTKLEAMDRFTDEELEDIYSAAKVNVSVEVWLEKFKQAQDTNLDDPRFIAGLGKLVTAGLLAANRPAEILA